MWKRKVVGVLFVASLATALVLIAAPSARADCPPQPEVKVHPSRVLEGESFTIDGAGFNPVSKVYIHLGEGGPRLASAQTTSTGKFTANIDTSSHSAGNWTLYVRGDGRCESSARLAVVTEWCPPAPTIGPAFQTGRGVTVTITGTGFAPNRVVLVNAHHAIAADSFTGFSHADGSGSVEIPLAIPPDALHGHWYLDVDGIAGCNVEGDMLVTCPYSPSGGVTPDPGVIGDVLRVNARNLTPGIPADVSLWAGGWEVMSDRVMVNDSGRLAVSFTLAADLAPGELRWLVEDDYFCRASAAFPVIAAPPETTTTSTTTTTTTTTVPPDDAAIDPAAPAAEDDGSSEEPLLATTTMPPDAGEVTAAAEVGVVGSESDPQGSLIAPAATATATATATTTTTTTPTESGVAFGGGDGGSADWLLIGLGIVGAAIVALALGVAIGRRQRPGHA